MNAFGKYGDKCENQYHSGNQHIGIPDNLFHTSNSSSSFAAVVAAMAAKATRRF
jgi:hypothetical protein